MLKSEIEAAAKDWTRASVPWLVESEERGEWNSQSSWCRVEAFKAGAVWALERVREKIATIDADQADISRNWLNVICTINEEDYGK